jgi:tetratricopeptide (TPR) repeat protein
MGNLALQAGSVDQAGEYYRRSVQVNPLNPTAHYNLGWLAERRGDLSSALGHYRAFARLDHPVFRAQLLALREHLLRSYGVTL